MILLLTLNPLVYSFFRTSCNKRLGIRNKNTDDGALYAWFPDVGGHKRKETACWFFWYIPTHPSAFWSHLREHTCNFTPLPPSPPTFSSYSFSLFHPNTFR